MFPRRKSFAFALTLLLLFRPLGLAQIEVVSGGNVGIGATSPTSKLQLEKSANDTVSLANSFFFFADTPLGAGLLGQQKLTSPYAFVLQAQNQTNNAFFPISLNPYGGSVGIGTSSPGEKLEVNGNIQLTANGQYYRTDVYSRLWTPGQSIGSVAYFGTYGPALTYNAKYNSGWKLISGGTASALAIVEGRFAYANSNTGSGGNAITWYDRFVIEPNGNVGIGTTTPGQKLEVAGSVRATSFISNSTTYADFVFDPGYRLAPLSEVEAHIKQLGHLPGIPSEAEAKEHGIDLAAMQVKLLQKIEELTLHVIRLDHENADLRRDMEKVKSYNYPR
jgi:hypothetical protein